MKPIAQANDLDIFWIGRLSSMWQQIFAVSQFRVSKICFWLFRSRVSHLKSRVSWMVYLKSQLSQHAENRWYPFSYSVPMRHFHPSLPPQVGSAVSVAFKAGMFNGNAFTPILARLIFAGHLARVRVAFSFSSTSSVWNFLTLSTPDSFFSDSSSRTWAWSSGFFSHMEYRGWMDNKFLDSRRKRRRRRRRRKRRRGSRFTMKLCRWSQWWLLLLLLLLVSRRS